MLTVLLCEGARSRDGGMKAPEELLRATRLPPETVWMGIYLAGQKIGFIQSELEPLPEGGYEISEISRMQAAILGVMQRMRLQMTAVTDSALALVSFDGEFATEQYSAIFKGRHYQRILKIELTTGGRTTEKVFPAPEPLYLSQAVKPLLQGGRLHSGDSLILSGFDPISLQMQDLVVVGADNQTHLLFGQEVRARKLITRMENLESVLYVDDHGEVIAEFGPMGLVMRRESAETALAMSDETAAVDFLNLYAVKPQGAFNSPRQCKLAAYKIRGFDVSVLPEVSGRQCLQEDSSLIVVYIPNPEVSASKFDSLWLNPAPLIESNAPEIIRAAQDAVKGGKTRLDSLGLLSEWVFKTVNKKPSAGLPSALAVLQQKEGDCNEHSALFTALARSLGIPARIQMGLVYQNDRFYYHAWPTARVDSQWFEFEPTFGQRLADAARIALTTGDLSAAIKITPAVGNIEIEILAEKANDK